MVFLDEVQLDIMIRLDLFANSITLAQISIVVFFIQTYYVLLIAILYNIRSINHLVASCSLTFSLERKLVDQDLLTILRNVHVQILV